jgi:hypothetical protein
MDELIAKIAQAANITEEAARKAVGIILGFVEKEAPQVGKVLSAVPGVDDLVAAAAAAAGASEGLLGKIGSMFGGAGGDVMAAWDRLTNEAGLLPGQIETVGKQTLDFLRAKLGDDTVSKIIAAVPGLSRFA